MHLDRRDLSEPLVDLHIGPRATTRPCLATTAGGTAEARMPLASR